MFVCKDKGELCEFANKYGYCLITGCVKQPDYIKTWVWMKPKEGQRDEA